MFFCSIKLLIVYQCLIETSNIKFIRVLEGIIKIERDYQPKKKKSRLNVTIL